MALQAWLRESPPAEDALLVLDPDCVFLAPLTEPVSRGHPIAQPISYLNPAHHTDFVKRHCRRPELVQGIGIPILIHRDDLATLLPLWVEQTEVIRNDRQSRERAGWISDMWGYAFAAAEMGLQHTECDLARFQTEDRTDLPIIHYCYSSSDDVGHWKWDKRTYRPWERVSEPPRTTPLASRVLIRLLNDWASMQGHRALR